MPGNYDITDKTYIRFDDRIDGDLLDAVFQKYAGTFSGKEWFVPHNLHSTNLLIAAWKFDPTNPASFYKIEQYNYDALMVKWTLPVEGKIVIYSVRDFVGVSMVYEQNTPSDIWTITHNFGTDDILFTVWVNDEAVAPVSTSIIDENTIEMTFAEPLDGKVVLIVTDPALSRGISIDWDQLVNVPLTFAPASHRHQVSEIDGLGDVDSLSGHKIDDFVLKTHIGDLVPPLEYENVTDTQKRIPLQYMPTNMFFNFADEAGIQRAQQLTVVSKDPHPLFLQKVPGKSEVVLDIYPVIRRVLLMGNVVPNMSIPKQQVEASSDFLLRLVLGDGLKAEATDLHTLKLMNQQGLAQVFKRVLLAQGQDWPLIDPIFRRMGEYSLSLYETIVSPYEYDAESNHIQGQTDIRQPFQVIGDNLMEINDDTIQDIELYDTGHFVYNDRTMKTSAGANILSPTDIDAVYWDYTRNGYMLRSQTGSGYVYRRYNPETQDLTTVYSVSSIQMPEWNAMCSGMFYSLQEDTTTGTLSLYSDHPDNTPYYSWDLVANFPSEPMPPTAGVGKLVFRVGAGLLIILNTTLNTLAVYDISARVKLSEKSLPKVAKDFDIWPDGFVSIAFEGESPLYVSDTGVFNNTYTWVPSLDREMGMCTCFAIQPTGRGALGIERGNTFRHATISIQDRTKVYAAGETTLWLRSSFAWRISPFWSQILSMHWEDYDITPYDDVRIGFYPGDHATIPDTLYSWDATNGFTPFAADDLKNVGQPLSVVDSMQLLGDQTLSYAIYIKKDLGLSLNRGHIVQNFLCRYKTADWMYPVPIGGPSNSGHILVKCGVGALTLTNNLGRDLNGLKLVVVPTV